MSRFYWIFPLLLLCAVACSNKSGFLTPLDPRQAPGGIISGEQRLVTFTELDANPSRYRNQLLRITGMFYRLPVQTCKPRSGPLTAWALHTNNILLEVVGFGQLSQLISSDEMVELTVDGIFRFYTGPMGCGKGAPDNSVWYLQLVRIVQPNILVKAFEGLVEIIPAVHPLTGEPTEESIADMTIVPTVDTVASPGMITIPTSTNQATILRSRTSTPTQTRTPIKSGVPTTTATATPTIILQATGTTSVTPTATRTETPGSNMTQPPSRTPRPTSTRNATLTPSITPTPTSTHTGYPGPSPVPTTYP